MHLNPKVLEDINLFNRISNIEKGRHNIVTRFKYQGFGLSHIGCQLPVCAKGIENIKLPLETTV